MLVMDEALQASLEALARAGKIAVDRNLTLATGGNFSCRTGNGIAITLSGTWLDRLDTTSFGYVPLKGDPDPDQPPVSVEWQMHQAAYQARPDAACVLHLHPQLCVMIDALGDQIRFVTLDHVYYALQYGRVPYLASGSSELAAAAAAQITANDTVILAHHGTLTVAENADLALQRLMNLEQAALMTYRLMQVGRSDGDFPDPGAALSI